MNNILTLRGQKFTQAKRQNGGGAVTVPKNAIIELTKLKDIYASLINVRDFWEDKSIIDGVLISVYYNQIVAKSNRIKGYLNGGKGAEPNDTVVGAKFNSQKTKHIITHFISRELLDKTIKLSGEIIATFSSIFPNGIITEKQFASPNTFENIDFNAFSFSKTTFKQYLRDTCFVDNFGIEVATKENLANSIVTLFDVKKDVTSLLQEIGVEITDGNVLNQNTVYLDERNVESLLNKAPYLVAMSVKDLTELSIEEFQESDEQKKVQLSAPENEPIIGVIDTLFNAKVYFNEWVEYHDLVSEDIRKEPVDYYHGTEVTSLIVDAPGLNSELDDGCGNFRVRHFGVSLNTGFSSFAIIKVIKEIVTQNPDIKVWNLSLGSDDEIRDNFISAEGATLDEIQYKYDVIFIIAGTNAKPTERIRKKIGAPADSLNSVIVNSVGFDGSPVSYSRKGMVLSFFVKPDIAYYGGEKNHFINVCDSRGIVKVSGTSYAAPLIARKIAYLIHIIGLSREEAKALLIDSAIGWNDKKTFEELMLIGNGVVPIKIADILSTSEDEIKFIISDVSEQYNSYNYKFPVPISKERYPYVAKATMCYFPNCSRNQGVDYTNTELNLVFGSLTDKGIKPINKDKQNIDDAPGYVREESARDIFRKWDNVKHIGEKFNERKRAKPILNPGNPQWGMSVKTIERLRKRDGQGIRFGVVVTLKEITGVNRIEDFINQAQLLGWIVNQVQIETQVDIYNKLSEEIEFI